MCVSNIRIRRHNTTSCIFTCMNTDICTYVHIIYIYIYIYTYIYIYIYICIYRCICIHIYVYVDGDRMDTNMNTYIYIYTYTNIRVYIFVCIYIYICVYTCVYRYILHTNILTHTRYRRTTKETEREKETKDTGPKSMTLRIQINVFTPYACRKFQNIAVDIYIFTSLFIYICIYI